jgi:hypothetical protein
MMNWFEWNSQTDFNNWHNALCNQLGYPLTPVNQATGLPDETAQKTIAYTSSILIGDKAIAQVDDEYADNLTLTDLRPVVVEPA